MKLNEVMDRTRISFRDPEDEPGAFDREAGARADMHRRLVSSTDSLNDIADQFVPGVTFSMKGDKITVSGKPKGQPFGISEVKVDTCYIMFNKVHVKLSYKPDQDWIKKINEAARQIGVPGSHEGKCASVEAVDGMVILNLGQTHNFFNDNYKWKVTKLLQEVESQLP